MPQRDAPRTASKYSLFLVSQNRRPDKGRFVRYAIGQDHQVAPVCILTLQRKTIWRLQIESGREKVEAKQSQRVRRHERPVRPPTQDRSRSGRWAGRTSGKKAYRLFGVEAARTIYRLYNHVRCIVEKEPKRRADKRCMRRIDVAVSIRQEK